MTAITRQIAIAGFVGTGAFATTGGLMASRDRYTKDSTYDTVLKNTTLGLVIAPLSPFAWGPIFAKSWSGRFAPMAAIAGAGAGLITGSLYGQATNYEPPAAAPVTGTRLASQPGGKDLTIEGLFAPYVPGPIEGTGGQIAPKFDSAREAVQWIRNVDDMEREYGEEGVFYDTLGVSFAVVLNSDERWWVTELERSDGSLPRTLEGYTPISGALPHYIVTLTGLYGHGADGRYTKLAVRDQMTEDSVINEPPVERHGRMPSRWPF